MLNSKKLGEVYLKDEKIDLDKISIEILESKVQEIECEEKNIKNKIFGILESL